MNFTTEKAIYVQIADRLCDEILTGKFVDDERIPSVREYAVLLEVNTNTAVKSYDLLEQRGVIYKKRGLGTRSADWATSSRQGPSSAYSASGERSSWRCACPSCSGRCGCSA